MLNKVFKDSFTENDGQSFDIARILLAFAAMTGLPFFFIMTAYSVYTDPTHHFDGRSFAEAFGIIVAAIAAHVLTIAVKQRTDTPVPNDQPESQQ